MIRRIAVIAVAAVAAAYLLYRWVYLPFVCNERHNPLEAHTASLADVIDDVERAALARRNVAEARRLCSKCPTTINFYQHLAASEYALLRKEDAVATYGRALAVDRRPEIYAARGAILFELGRIDEAVDDYTKAVKFYPAMIGNISSPYVERLVRARLRMPPE